MTPFAKYWTLCVEWRHEKHVAESNERIHRHKTQGVCPSGAGKANAHPRRCVRDDGPGRFPRSALYVLRHVASFRFPFKDTTPPRNHLDYITHSCRCVGEKQTGVQQVQCTNIVTVSTNSDFQIVTKSTFYVTSECTQAMARIARLSAMAAESRTRLLCWRCTLISCDG